MQFLTSEQCQAWCLDHGVRLAEQTKHPDIYLDRPLGYHITKFPYPKDAGAKIVGIPSRRLIVGFGSLHCLTMQKPA